MNSQAQSQTPASPEKEAPQSNQPGQTPPTTVPSVKGVRELLREQKKEAEGTEETETLPKSGLKVTLPGFINHGLWMRAQRLAKGDTAKAQTAFMAEISRFGDNQEKLTNTDIEELLQTKDTFTILGMIFGEEGVSTKVGAKGKTDEGQSVGE